MRKIDKKYHYLYKTTNLLNSKFYYGIHSTNNLEDGYLGSGKHLTYSIRKYGKDNFKKEIIEYFNTRENLIQAEIILLTREILENKQCMNIKFGGDCGTLGRANVKDKNGKCFSVFNDDPRYLSGELVGVTAGKASVKDKTGKFFLIDINDPRYLSGELVSISIGKINVKNESGNKFQVDKTDPRYLSGELVHTSKGKIVVKDKDGNTFQVDKTDPKYLNNEFTNIWKDRKHSAETKLKMSESRKNIILNIKHGSIGSCWIMNKQESKKIKKEELEHYISLGWIKGRQMKY